MLTARRGFCVKTYELKAVTRHKNTPYITERCRFECAPPCAVGSELAHIHTTFCRVIETDTHLRPGTVRSSTRSRSAHLLRQSGDRTEMSGAVKDEPRAPGECQRTEMIHVAVKSLSESKDFTVRGDCTVRQVRRPQHPGVGVLAV